MAPQREVNEVDILFVGAGPASLAGAIHLARLVNRHNEGVKNGSLQGKKLDDPLIAVIEKGAIGAHGISGGVMDPKGLRELYPDLEAAGVPLETPVTSDEADFLSSKRRYKFPVTPPPFQNHGNYIVSLNKLVTWMAKKAEEEGVNLFPEFPGAELLYEGDQVVGVRTTDVGVDAKGQPKGNFNPGMDLKAKVTILGEGTRGTLTKQLIAKAKLDEGRNPQVWTAGVKEIWRIKPENHRLGWVAHTMGYPLKNEEFGGSFIYHLPDNLVSIGMVVGLDYQDPLFDPHRTLQMLKTHPWVAKMLEGGELLRYGAKTIPEGGWWSIPQMAVGGAMLIGDSAGLVNAARLKGIHIAIKSGMLAAEQAFAAMVAEDYSFEALKGYETAFKQSWAGQELYKVRNLHQGFEGGLLSGMFHTGLQMVSGGRGLKDRYHSVAGHRRMKTIKAYYGGEKATVDFKPDGKLTFSKLDDVYKSGTSHEENQPPHLRIADWDLCNTKCKEEYGNPCQHFCPAAVYEMEGEGAERHLKLNPSNCVHCKTCDIMDPYQIITWVAPEGGGGPVYTGM